MHGAVGVSTLKAAIADSTSWVPSLTIGDEFLPFRASFLVNFLESYLVEVQLLRTILPETV
jgi:hypothetical protein